MIFKLIDLLIFLYIMILHFYHHFYIFHLLMASLLKNLPYLIQYYKSFLYYYFFQRYKFLLFHQF